MNTDGSIWQHTPCRTNHSFNTGARPDQDGNPCKTCETDDRKWQYVGFDPGDSEEDF